MSNDRADNQAGTEKLAPVQATARSHPSKGASIPWAVHMRAYEVYSVVWGPQQALIDLEGRNCRGGFGVGELIAFLYASGFPQSEWRQRFNEALEGADIK